MKKIQKQELLGSKKKIEKYCPPKYHQRPTNVRKLVNYAIFGDFLKNNPITHIFFQILCFLNG